MTSRKRPTVEGVEVDHHTVETNGVNLHVARAGPEGGDPVVLLHGFPDFWYGWRRQIPRLVEEGYRVWVPDQRGYNESEKPRRVADYALPELESDLIGLVDAMDADAAAIVGHDWGGEVGWRTAIEAPERVERLVAINAPHPTAFRRRVGRDPRQMLRSWYVLAYQVPALPEALFRAADWRLLAAALERGSLPGTFTADDLDAYRGAWSEFGAMEGMINWYRAPFRVETPPPADPHVAPPTTVFWGTGDPALREPLASESVDLCEDGRLVRFHGARHWPHLSAPDQVNDLLVAALAGEQLE